MSMLSAGDFFWEEQLKRIRLETDRELFRLRAVSGADFELLEHLCAQKETAEAVADLDTFAKDCSAGCKAESALHVNPVVEVQRGLCDLARQYKEYEKQCDTTILALGATAGAVAPAVSPGVAPAVAPSDYPTTHLLERRVLADHATTAGAVAPAVSPGVATESATVAKFRRRFQRKVARWAKETDKNKAKYQIMIPTEDMMQKHFSISSTLPFKLSDVPEKELRDRLAKGEIAPRKEFIPGAVEGERVALDEGAFNERMEFATQIHAEGKAEFAKQNFERAATLFVQGYRLLEYVTGDVETRTWDIDHLTNIFQRNVAVCFLRLGQWNESEKYATLSLKTDPFDAKAQFLRGRARLLLGRLPEAEADFGDSVRNPHATDEQRRAAKLALAELKNIKQRGDGDMKKYLEKLPAETRTGALAGDMQPVLSTTPTVSHPPAVPSTPSAPSVLTIPFDSFVVLCKELLSVYTSEEVSKKINSERRLADFDTRRTLIRLKKFLPQVAEPVWRKYGCESQGAFDRHFWGYRREMKDDKDFENLTNAILECLSIGDE